jgi:pimeloyl-ACP methyl ester carboxylesterase
MDENVIYDLPASIEYVKEATGAKKINYIGHSQGTTVFFMLYMHNPSYIESSINKFIGLGTVPNIAYSKSLPMSILDKIYDVLKMVKPLTKAIGFSDNQRSILSGACEKAQNLCLNSFEKLASLTPTYRAKVERLFPFLFYYPGGTSANTVLHWSQIYKEKKLVYFNKDYDDESEVKEYDTKNIKKWKIKSFVQRSDSDSFSSYDDVTEFYEEIENKSLIKLVDTPMYGHTDDLVADSALDEVYIPVIDFLDE